MKPKPKRPGRPKVLTDAIVEGLFTLVMNGTTLKRACERVGINDSTVRRKAIEEPEFARDLARAREAGAYAANDEALDAIRNAETVLDIAKARELAIHARWVASKLLPEYRDRGPVGAPLQPMDPNALPTTERGWLEIGRRIAYTLKTAADLAPRPYQPRLPATIDVSPGAYGGDGLRPHSEASE